MSQYSRISQLQQRITELRMRGLEDRVEIRQLRNLVSEQKTSLEAAQLEIEALKRELYVTQRANETAHRYAGSLNDLLDARETTLAAYERQDKVAAVLRDTGNAETTHLTGTREEKSAQLMAMFDKERREPAECNDYRQYESLAVQEAFGRGMARYAGAMQKLAESD